MMTTLLRMMTLVGAIGLGVVTFAQMPVSAAEDTVYGSQLMTARERMEYRQRMQSARTEAERLAIRNEHHERMRARAQEMGVTLPDAPPAQGMGRRQNDGAGGRRGHGGGRRE